MRRIAIALVTVAIVLVVMALPAAAHVTVSPSQATKGGFATLTFQVPNEQQKATTTKLQVKFPEDTPIADASVEAVAGWTIDVVKAKLGTPITTDEGDSLDERVDTITWTASGDAAIRPGYFQQFRVSVGLPDADSIVFPAIQTYSNGDEVDWVQTAAPGGEEPAHPAPVLTLVEGESAGGGATATTAPAATNNGSASAATTSTVSKDDVDNAKTLAIVALIVGIVGVLVGIGGFVMGRRRA